jgi:hypothetical protein
LPNASWKRKKWSQDWRFGIMKCLQKGQKIEHNDGAKTRATFVEKDDGKLKSQINEQLVNARVIWELEEYERQSCINWTKESTKINRNKRRRKWSGQMLEETGDSVSESDRN